MRNYNSITVKMLSIALKFGLKDQKLKPIFEKSGLTVKTKPARFNGFIIMEDSADPITVF